MRTAEQVTFGGSGLDRAADLRTQPEGLATALSDPATQILPLWQGKPMVQPAEGDMLRLATVAPGHPILDHAAEAPLLLGRSDGAAWFAVDVSSWTPEGQDVGAVGAFLDPTEQRFPGTPDDQRFSELRAIMTRLDRRNAELAATARAMLTWHSTHGFCARCGGKSDMGEAGWMRECPDCGAKHFPRTDPVVIMLITHGNDVLVGRSPGWPEGMYSLLAGFVEPGETIEAAVRREVMEEAGISVGAVGYLSSQPWPFPASLMFGCQGQATSRDITVDPAELEDARWVSREDMLVALSGEHPEIKPARQGAIARFLIDAWLADRLD